ncbi:MAG: AAA family ATPase [Myxococcota bacterium]
MIRLDRVELLHWDLQPHQVLPLAAGVTLVTGENGSGKTSILDALKVGLGAIRLGGDRTIDGYLLRQAQPLAMIRVLLDNRPAAGSRRRPCDALGEHRQDVVTLAVVMRQDDEASYRREYFILDGDVVPSSVSGAERKGRGPVERVLTHKDYLERLRKLGIGREYLKLLCLPQGQIASLCQRDPARLFDELFDVIGGREALDAWEACRRELATEQRLQATVGDELRQRRLELDVLGQRVKRHGDYIARAETLDARRAALPHVRRAHARQAAMDAARAEETARKDLAAQEAIVAERRGRWQEALERATAAERVRAAARAAEAKAAEGWGEAVTAHAHLAARRGELQKLRDAGVGVAPRDPAELEREAEAVRVDIAHGAAAEQLGAERRGAVASELERLEKGLQSFPPEVDRFRDALRGAGIMHHVLAEVLDVAEEAWAPALEGYLGRHRFAVLVQDPERWAEAALLARAARYPHGVLAPDVRGRSPADEEGLMPIVTVGEPRYRSLVARLLRRVLPGEPPEPLEPARRDEHLAADGFLVTRLEARVAAAERGYLWRRARELRKAELEAERARLDAESDAWRAARRALEATLARIAAEREAQRRRLAWEAARDEHARVQADEAAASERVATSKTDRELAASERKRAEDDAGETDRVATRSEGDAESAERKRADRAEALLRATAARVAAEGELGALLAEPLAEPDARVARVLADGYPHETLRRLVESGEEELARYEPAERDPMLPVNHARQASEVDAIERRLAAIAERQEATRTAAEAAHALYKEATQRVFRGYFGRLAVDARELDWVVEGRLVGRDDGRFECLVRIGIGEKPLVAHDAEELSGGQKAALSILMSMTAVSLEADGAAFFVVDEPFSASDVTKMNELGAFLARTGAQYLLSMPTSADLEQCGAWLQAIWICTRSRGGLDARGRPRSAPPVKLGFAPAARLASSDA